MSKHLLFIFEPYEQLGGISDLCFVGAIEECIAAAEASQHGSIAQIVDHETLRMVRRGEWGTEIRSDSTGLAADMRTHDWCFKWDEDDGNWCKPLNFARDPHATP